LWSTRDYFEIGNNFLFLINSFFFLIYRYDIFIDPSLPWEDIRSAFISAFQPPDFSNKSRTELVSLHQGNNETVTHYHVRMLWILKKWPEHGMSEDILKGIFIDGLREELKERVVPQRPATLDEVVTLAAIWEQAVDIREAWRKASKMVKCDFCGLDGHELNTCEVRWRMKELWASNDNGGLERQDGEAQAENAKALVALKRSDSTRSSVQCQCQRHQCWKKAEGEL
jgi:Retrotransposon gag protein